VVVAAGIVLRFSPASWALVALAIGLVVAAELLNTAIEAVVDLVSPGEHPLAERAKDLAAAGVLVASVAALAAGLFVLAATVAAR
jgi:diacylglycerol kinase